MLQMQVGARGIITITKLFFFVRTALFMSMFVEGMHFPRYSIHVLTASAAVVSEDKPIEPVHHQDNPIVFMDIEISGVAKGRIIYEVFPSCCC